MSELIDGVEGEVDLSIVPTPYDLIVKAQEMYENEGIGWYAGIGLAANYFGRLSSRRSGTEKYQITDAEDRAFRLLQDEMDPVKAFQRATVVAEVLYNG